MSPKPCILAVDDDLNDRRLIYRTLEESCDVVVCGSGEEGLALVDNLTATSETVFDVVIADYHLPGMSGIEFLSRLAVSQPDVGRLLITADKGVDRAMFPIVMLFKPVPPEVLERFVRQLSVMARRLRELRARGGKPTGGFPVLPRKPDGETS